MVLAVLRLAEANGIYTEAVERRLRSGLTIFGFFTAVGLPLSGYKYFDVAARACHAALVSRRAPHHPERRQGADVDATVPGGAVSGAAVPRLGPFVPPLLAFGTQTRRIRACAI